ncbi:MAG: hypothetical protein IH596_15425 [Bacteroidales bacterium]|nr:hypothetical protein [Bacteroidales bacterium]
MKKLMKIDGWIAAIIGIILLAVGIIIFLIEANFEAMTWKDWYEASIPFILWAICMRIFAYTHEEKKKE